MGNTADECAKKLTEAGADCVGANCGDLDPEQMAVVVGLLKDATSVPVLAQPNAGKPKLIEDKTVFDMDADTFAKGISKCIDAGANIVGGCCGTSPEHIKAVADLLS
jgi:5-methyltetrahydrofolate--homocysteine methyltransferase